MESIIQVLSITTSVPNYPPPSPKTKSWITTDFSNLLLFCKQEVVKAIQEAQAMKHLVSMATSEHAIMQNEALIALAIASAVNLGIQAFIS